jgi:hypothetical protein
MGFEIARNHMSRRRIELFKMVDDYYFGKIQSLKFLSQGIDKPVIRQIGPIHSLQALVKLFQ